MSIAPSRSVWAPRPPRPADDTTPISVVVVDDQALFRQAIARLVDGQPDLTVVGQGSNGIQAAELCRELQPDVLLMDVEMPVMDGIQAAGLVLADVPRTRVVMLTVSDADEHLLPAVRQGVHGYLLKDMCPDELFETLRQVVRGETPVAPSLVGRLLAELRGTPAPAAAPTSDDQQALSRRELEILQLVAAGLSNREIATRLSITEGTVKNHVHNALQKLHLDNRIQAASYIVRQGLGIESF